MNSWHAQRDLYTCMPKTVQLNGLDAGQHELIPTILIGENDHQELQPQFPLHKKYRFGSGTLFVHLNPGSKM